MDIIIKKFGMLKFVKVNNHPHHKNSRTDPTDKIYIYIPQCKYYDKIDA